jgi:Skp family chaperone for outer membrane proteins
MANSRDIAGLLTGIPSGGIDPRGGMTGRQMLTQSALAGQQRMASGLRGMFNMGATPQQQIQQKLGQSIQGFDTKTIDEQKKLVAMLQMSGQTGLATQLASRLKDNVATQQQAQKLELNKKVVERLYPETEWAADFAAQGVPLSIIKELTSDTNADRGATYKWVVDTYGAEEANKLKPVIMAGQVKPQDIPSLIPDDSISIASRQNVDYIDSDGKVQTTLVMFSGDGKTYDATGKPVKLPENAQLSVVGRTPTDVNFERKEDGTFGAPLSDKHRSEIIEDINGSIALLDEVEKIGTEELENTLTYLGKAKRWAGGISSALQVGELAESKSKVLQAIGEKAESLEDFGGESTVIFDKLQQYFNKRRHDITGAQASIKELAELRKGLLSGESKPNEAKARIAEIIRRERDSINRNQMLLEKNLMSWDSYTNVPAWSEDRLDLTDEEEQNVTPNSIINRALGIDE